MPQAIEVLGESEKEALSPLAYPGDEPERVPEGPCRSLRQQHLLFHIDQISGERTALTGDNPVPSMAAKAAHRFSQPACRPLSSSSRFNKCALGA
jgi:hypothetical protein